jgi:thiamine kinase-like enzyme
VERAREAMVTRAAVDLGLAPELVHVEPGIMVSRFIDGHTFGPEDVRARRADVAALIRRFHTGMGERISGAGFIFWVFHVIRDYANTLKSSKNPVAQERLKDLLDVNEELEAAQVPLRVTFGHNDLLPANIIDDGDRLWLIDFEYSGFNTAMFDLAGLSSNASFTEAQSDELLTAYFGREPNADSRMALAAMQCASLLREALWSLVSEMYLGAPGADYDAYAKHNFARFDAALAAYRAKFNRG